MSLRVFHIVFIIVTTALSLWVALWGVREYSQEQNTTGLALAVIFFAAAAGLIYYGKKVYRKLKELP